MAKNKVTLWKNIQTLMGEFLELFNPTPIPSAQPTTEQAISMPDIYSNVGYALTPMTPEGYYDESQPYKRLIDCYVDDAGAIVALVGMEGKLYTMPVTISNGVVELGEMTQIEIDFKPVAQSFRVSQQADGKMRWYAMPAATAVLNDNGYLNSRELYDNFVKHIQDGDAPMPFLSFYHIGESVNLGQADFVEREGYTLIVSGTFNDSPLAQRLAKSSDVWNGISIGYLVDPDTIQTLEIGNGVKLPVHTDGILIEISALQEIDAACVMTAFYSKGVTQMKQETLKKLKKLAGADPAALAQVEGLAEQVDQTNAAIEDQNLIRQSKTSTPAATTAQETTPPVEPQAVEPPAAAVPTEITLTDEAVQAIAEQVRSGFVTDMTAFQATYQTKLDELKTGFDTTLVGLQSRLDALEQTDQAKVAQVVSDLPRSTVVVGYQPRNQGKPPVETPPTELDPSDVANETLAKIKAAQAHH
jgi:hypothetical protein